MSDVRYAMVHYRKLVREDAAISDGKTLSHAIGEALDRQHLNGGIYRDNWRYRLTPPPDDADQRRLANNVHTDAETAFGNLCAYTPGDLQALIDANTVSGDSANVAESIAPSGNEYLKGIAYWLVVGDHCYIVQHIAVRTKALEEYLTWFLRDATQIIGSSGTITLQAAFDAASVGGDLDNVHSIEIGGLVPETVRDTVPPIPPEGTQTRKIEERRTLGGGKALFEKAVKVLSDILGPLEAEKILAKVPPEAALEVMVNIGYRAKRRGVDRATMSELATSLRNIDDGEVKILAKDGKLQGDAVWLQAQMPFKRMRSNGNLLDLENVRNQLREVHRRFLHDGRIS